MPHTTKRNESSTTTTTTDWNILLYGQYVALSLACCSAASSTLQSMPGIHNMPLFQIAGGYFFLSLNLLKLKRKSEDIFETSNCSSTESTESNSQHIIEEKEVDTEHTLLISSLDEENSFIITQFEKNLDRTSAGVADGRINIDDKNDTIVDTLYNIPLTNISLHSPWYFYLLLAFLDVQANYFVVLSFRFTALVNTNLLTSLSIISVMTTSKIILKRVFRAPHFIGAFLVLSGAFLIVTSDVKDETIGLQMPTTPSLTGNDEINNALEEGSNLHFRGDLLAITASLLFGLNDSLAEYCIHVSTVEEYLAMLGLFGFFFAMGESLCFEYTKIKGFIKVILHTLFKPYFERYHLAAAADEVNTGDEEGIDFFKMFFVWTTYMCCLVFFYTSASRFLRIADATLLNLSLQSTNIWTMIYSIVVQCIVPTISFYLAILLIFIGVFIYEKGIPKVFVRFTRENSFASPS